MTDLGDFLRSRRDAAQPAALGLPGGSGRRVTGLRREEVAALAGVNVDYYRRLEQGREQHPSMQVLGSIARALDLDRAERGHLFRLAGVLPAVHAVPASVVDLHLLRLLDQWPMHPAMVLDDALDLLAANRMARVLHDGFAAADNLALMIFADPFGLSFYLDWEEVATDTAANLRLGRGRTAHPARIDAIVAALSITSDDFATLWRRNEVREKAHDRKRVQHPEVGRLVLDFETLRVEGAEEQYLLVYHPADTRSAEGLQLLASLGASGQSADSGR